jgi:hypothetical protein
VTSVTFFRCFTFIFGMLQSNWFNDLRDDLSVMTFLNVMEIMKILRNVSHVATVRNQTFAKLLMFT